MKPERALLVLSVLINVLLSVFVSVAVINKGKDLSTMRYLLERGQRQDREIESLRELLSASNTNGCSATKVTMMATYLDPNAPDFYLQGPFGKGPGVCSIIHSENEEVTPEQITTICSLTPDQFGNGYVYHSEVPFLDEWVYKIQCDGEEARYTYDGYDWSKWVRPNETESGDS